VASSPVKGARKRILLAPPSLVLSHNFAITALSQLHFGNEEKDEENKKRTKEHKREQNRTKEEEQRVTKSNKE
jgi:hypothetical protein